MFSGRFSQSSLSFSTSCGALLVLILSIKWVLLLENSFAAFSIFLNWVADCVILIADFVSDLEMLPQSSLLNARVIVDTLPVLELICLERTGHFPCASLMVPIVIMPSVTIHMDSVSSYGPYYFHGSCLTLSWCHYFIIISHSSTLLHSDIIMISSLHFTLLWLHYNLILLHYDIITSIVLLVYKQLYTCLYSPSLVWLKYTWVLAKASHPLSLILWYFIQDNSPSWSLTKCDQSSLSQVLSCPC